jgi:hypothetical protein
MTRNVPCVYIHACIYVCTYACIHVCMHAWFYSVNMAYLRNPVHVHDHRHKILVHTHIHIYSRCEDGHTIRMCTVGKVRYKDADKLCIHTHKCFMKAGSGYIMGTFKASHIYIYIYIYIHTHTHAHACLGKSTEDI